MRNCCRHGRVESWETCKPKNNEGFVSWGRTMKSLVAHFSTPLITARLVPTCLVHRASISADSFPTVRRRYSPLTMASAAQSSSQVSIWMIQCLEFYWWICVLIWIVVGGLYWYSSGISVNLYLDWCGSLICNVCAIICVLVFQEFFVLYPFSVIRERKGRIFFKMPDLCIYKLYEDAMLDWKGESYIRPWFFVIPNFL